MSIISILIIAALAAENLAWPGPSASGNGIFALFGLFILGIVQLLSAVFNFIRGSKVQGLYLLFSIVFLLVYAAGIGGYIDFPGTEDERGIVNWLTWPPLLMACVYTVILFFDPVSRADRGQAPLADTLDDGEWID